LPRTAINSRRFIAPPKPVGGIVAGQTSRLEVVWSAPGNVRFGSEADISQERTLIERTGTSAMSQKQTLRASYSTTSPAHSRIHTGAGDLDLRNWESEMTRKSICLIVGCLMFAATARGETIGVVMMHGKHGTPAQLQQLAVTIADAGFLVERPEMCWSAARIYDRTYLECFADIDAAAARLKEHGATAIVVLGMSLGGDAALGFAARHRGLKAVIALAPAHAPEFLSRRPEIAQ